MPKNQNIDFLARRSIIYWFIIEWNGYFYFFFFLNNYKVSSFEKSSQFYEAINQHTYSTKFVPVSLSGFS